MTTNPHGGGWPKGRRRHADTGDWQAVRLGLRSLLEHHPLRGVRSLQAIADALGVPERRTVHRWLTGERRPSPEHQDLLRAWLREQRDLVAAQKRK